MSDPSLQPPNALRYFAWLMLAAAACFQLALITAPVTYLAESVTVDDTYLYLQIARNWADLGFPTFDGENPTSGFQPLWNFVLVALASLITDREILLRAACLVTAVLNVVTAPLILRLGKQVSTPNVAYLAMVGWSLYLFCPRSPNGMESSLHGVIFALGALVAVPAWRDINSVSPGKWLWFGGLLALNGLCRLDSGIVSAMVAGLFAWRLIEQKQWKLLALMCLLPVMFVSVYFGANQVYFGSPTPISGRVKMHWAHTALNYSTTGAILTTVTGTIRTFCHSLMYVSGGGEAYSYPWLPILLVVMAWTLGYSWWRGMLDARLIAWGAMLLVQTLIIHYTLQHLGKSYWYYQPLRIWASLIVAHIALLRVPGVSDSIIRVVRTLLVLWVCSFGIVRGLSLYSQRYVTRLDHIDRFETRGLTMALWLHQTNLLPPGARLGSWNAGILGYFGEPKRVFNLDGLVQSNDYLPVVIHPRAWKKYLREEKIDYLVDTNYQDSTQTYQRKWDREKVFRGLVPFDETKIVKQMGPLFLLDIRPWLATPDDEE